VVTDSDPPQEAESSRLHGLTVVAFESRRAQELAEAIRRHGGAPVSAPAMTERARDDRQDLLAYLQELESGQIDIVVLLTGVGLRMLVHQLRSDAQPERIAAALRNAVLIARGPKPVAALRDLGLVPQWRVPEPHTWKELLALLDRHVPVAGKTVALQEYGVPNTSLLDALAERGARVRRVVPYQWDYPEQLEPLREGIRTVLDGKAAVVVFTSANQVHNVFAFVEHEFEAELERWRTRLREVVLASIGPVCSEALRAHGLEPDLEASPPKMGVLVRELARSAAACLQHKRPTR